MTNTLQIFENRNFGSIRTVLDESGKALFCGKDIAEALGYSNTKDALIRHCRGVVKHDLGVVTGKKADGTDAIQNVAVSFIPEGDVYRLIVRSNLPSAEKFERWVFDEVLPAIRKTGGYITSTPNDSDADIIARGYRAAIAAIERKDQTIAALEAQREEAAPYTDLGRAVSEKAGYMLISEAAVIMAQAGCMFTVQETGERRIIGVQYLRIYLEQKEFIVKRGRSDAGRPTIKGQRYKIQMKASPLGNGHVGYSPVLPAPFVRVLIDMFHKKEMILPKIAKEGRSVRVNFLEDTT